jgi:hypothetical protein
MLQLTVGGRVILSKIIKEYELFQFLNFTQIVEFAISSILEATPPPHNNCNSGVAVKGARPGKISNKYKKNKRNTSYQCNAKRNRKARFLNHLWELSVPAWQL